MPLLSQWEWISLNVFFFFCSEGPEVFVEMTLSALFCNLHALNKSSVGTNCSTAAASTLAQIL